MPLRPGGGRCRRRPAAAAVAAAATAAAAAWAAAHLPRCAAAAPAVSAAAAAEAAAEGRDRWSSQAIVEQATGLQQEIAALKAEALRLRLDDKEDFTIIDAFRHTEKARLELADLQDEVTQLRWSKISPEARAAGGAKGLIPATFEPGPDGADHGRTLFATLCAGTMFFDQFCGPFLASFERTYGALARKHRVLVFIANVQSWMIEAAGARFRPWVRFVPLRLGDEEEEVYRVGGDAHGQFMCDREEGAAMAHCEVQNVHTDNRKKKVDFRDTLLQSGITDYLEQHEDNFCYAVFIDSDTLFVRPLGPFLPACGAAEQGRSRELDHSSGTRRDSSLAIGVDWDVAITAYDSNFVVPWSNDVTKVSRTRNGFVRVNGGVVFVSLQRFELAKRFLKRWADVAVWLESKGEDPVDGVAWSQADKAQWVTWHDDLNAEFRGPSQASLVLLLCSYDMGRLRELLGWGRCKVCAETVDASIELVKGEQPLPIRFRALPARQLNHPESMPNNGVFAEDLRIVHLKGFWWRQVLPKGAHFLVDEFRRASWNRDTIFLHKQLYETWLRALPLEWRQVQPPSGFSTPDGKQLNLDEMRKILEN